MATFLLLLLVVVTLLVAIKANARSQELDERIRWLEVEIARLNREHRGKEPTSGPTSHPLTESHPKEHDVPPGQEVTEDLPPFVSAPPPLPPFEPAASFETLTAPVEAKPIDTPAAEPRPPFSWEQFLGAKLFAWVGGVALFIGVAFFIKYSFERNLIPPSVRVSIGAALGVILAAVGPAIRRREYAVTAQTLSASGILIAYASIFSAHALYHLISAPLAFGLLTVVTVGAFGLALRMDSKAVAVLGWIVGFITPELLLRSNRETIPTFTYFALLDAGLIAVALIRKWRFMGALGATGTTLALLHWSFNAGAGNPIALGFGLHLGFVALFYAALFAARKWHRDDELWGAGITMVCIAGFMHGVNITMSSLFDGHEAATLGYMFTIDVALIGVCLLYPGYSRALPIVGSAMFLYLLSVSNLARSKETLWVALAAYFVFGVLHALLPIALQRMGRDVGPARAAQAFGLLTLLFTFAPLLLGADFGALFWLALIALNLIAVAVAIYTRSPMMLLGASASMMLFGAVWLGRFRHGGALPSPLLLFILVAGASYASLTGLAHKLQKSGEDTADPSDVEVATALNLAMPFALLALAVSRFELQNPTPVFGVAAALLLLGFYLVRKIGRHLAIPILGMALIVVEVVWLKNHWSTAQSGSGSIWACVFIGLFVGYALVFVEPRGQGRISWATAALAAPLQLFFIHLLWSNNPQYTAAAGALPALLTVANAVGIWRLLHLMPAEDPERTANLAWMAGGGLFLVSMIFPFQFGKEILTLGWAIEGAALIWLAQRVPHRGLLAAGVGLLAIAFGRLALNPAVLAYHPRTGTPVFNWYTYAYAIAAACMFVGAALWKYVAALWPEMKARPFLASLGTILLFLLLNIQIADYYATGPTLTFEFDRSLGKNMTYSIAWGLFALGLIIAGIVKRLAGSRYAGIGLLCVTLVKLFFFDLRTLDAIYRIAAFIGVAIILITASFLYQRFLARKE